MKHLETKFKRELVDACIARGAYAIRHEDKYGLGRLDLTIKFPQFVEVHAEGKLVPHQSFAPTLRQWEEGERWLKANALAILIGWDPKTHQMFIHEWAKTATKAGSFCSEAFETHAEALEAWLARR